jgi:glutamyl/glutaminyl-tRNA synthetase
VGEQHLRNLSLEDLAVRLVGAFPETFQNISHERLVDVIRFMRERASTLKELRNELEIFLSSPVFNTEESRKALSAPKAHSILQSILGVLEKDWTGDSFPVKSLSVCQKELGVSGSEFYTLFRLSLTGHPHGPELKEFCPKLGKEEVLERLKKAIPFTQS